MPPYQSSSFPYPPAPELGTSIAPLPWSLQGPASCIRRKAAELRKQPHSPAGAGQNSNRNTAHLQPPPLAAARGAPSSPPQRALYPPPPPPPEIKDRLQLPLCSRLRAQTARAPRLWVQSMNAPNLGRGTSCARTQQLPSPQKSNEEIYPGLGYNS